MELHFHYLEKVQLVDDMIEKHKKVCDSTVFCSELWCIVE